MSGRIDVDPQGLTVAVTFTTLAGGAVQAYSDAGLSTPLTAPIVISNLATFYLPADGPYLCSLTMGGVELGPVQVRGLAGDPAVVAVRGLISETKQAQLLSTALAFGSGQMVAGPAQLSAFFDVLAVGNAAFADVTGMSIAVPASPTRGVMLRFKGETSINMNTVASGSINSILAVITDNSNNQLTMDAAPAVSTGASLGQSGKLNLEAFLPAPVAAATYKVRAKMASAVGAASLARIIPSYGLVAGAVDNFYAEAK